MTNLEALKIAHRIQKRLLMIRQTLEIAELKEPDMAVTPQAAALISEFDVATSAIGVRIQALVDKQNNMSPEDQAAFQAEVDKLTALGQDPANPVPTA